MEFFLTKPYIHPTADVHPSAILSEGVKVWANAQVRERAVLGKNVIIGKGAFIDFDVIIGDNCKIQNYVCVYHGAILEDGVFLGPSVLVLNDKLPRAINPDGSLKTTDDWTVSGVTLRKGAAIGGGSILVPGVTVGKWAMTGSGTVVSRDVPPNALVVGNPSRIIGYVDEYGERIANPHKNDN